MANFTACCFKVLKIDKFYLLIRYLFLSTIQCYWWCHCWIAFWVLLVTFLMIVLSLLVILILWVVFSVLLSCDPCVTHLHTHNNIMRLICTANLGTRCSEAHLNGILLYCTRCTSLLLIQNYSSISFKIIYCYVIIFLSKNYLKLHKLNWSYHFI